MSSKKSCTIKIRNLNVIFVHVSACKKYVMGISNMDRYELWYKLLLGI